jgi:hypothetical protein
MATIHVNRSGNNLGTFSEEDVRAGLRSGRFLPTDLGWREGMPQWQPLSTFSEFASDIPAGVVPSAPSPPQPPGVYVAPSPPSGRTEPLAIWSFVLSIVSLVCCGFILGIPAVVMGHLALSNIRKTPGLEGRGLAIAGLAIGYVSCAFWIIWILFCGGMGFFQALSQSLSK